MISRQLGLVMCTALVVGNTIGMGIFMQPAALAPFGLNALTGWLAVIVGCVCLAIVYAALARRMPDADGPFGYVRATLGEPVAFPALWCYWISVWVTNAVLAVSVVGYFVSVFPAARAVPSAALTFTFMWLFIGVNLLGVRSGGRVQVLTSLLKLIPLVLVMVLGPIAILGEPSAYVSNVPTTPVELLPTMTATTIALYAMLGFESAAVAAGRVRDPVRTIPRATLLGTLIVAVIYVAIVAIGMLLVPQETLAQSDAPFVLILDTLLGAGSGRWIALFVVVSGLGALNGWTLLSGELSRTLATHRLLPPVFASVNRFGAPWAGLLLTGGLAAFVALMNYNASLVAGFTLLSVIVTAANLPLYLVSALALLYLRVREPAAISPWVWVAGLGGIAFILFTFRGIGMEPLLWAAALAAAGVPVYFWMRWRHPAEAVPAPGS